MVAVERVERHEHDAFAVAVVDDLVPAAVGEVVLVLDGSIGTTVARALDLLDADLRQADVLMTPRSRYAASTPSVVSRGVSVSTRCR